jgi:phage gp16-like protein
MRRALRFDVEQHNVQMSVIQQLIQENAEKTREVQKLESDIAQFKMANDHLMQLTDVLQESRDQFAIKAQHFESQATRLKDELHEMTRKKQGWKNLAKTPRVAAVHEFMAAVDSALDEYRNKIDTPDTPPQ